MSTQWLTLTQAADYIGAKHPRMIRDAIKAGDLPAYHYGVKDLRVTAEDIDAWLRSRPFNGS
jgi:excisionase family DNA binding protein